MRHKGSSGFTLLELMITIAIMSILLVLAVPSFESTIRSNRAATATNELLASISLARTEAIRNARSAGVCTSVNGTSCGGGWNDGWIVWLDNVNPNNGSIDLGERVVRRVEPHAKLTMTSTASCGAACSTIFNFDTRGRVFDDEIRTITLQPAVCTAGATMLRTMTINRSGQVRVVKSACP